MFYKKVKIFVLFLLLACFLVISVGVANAQVGPKRTTMGNENDDVFHFLGSIGINNSVFPLPLDARLVISPESTQNALIIESHPTMNPFTIKQKSGGVVRFLIDGTGKVTVGDIPWARLTGIPENCDPGEFVTGLGDSLFCAVPSGGGTTESYWELSSGNVYRSSGKVGIGLSSPNRQLHIYQTSGDNAEINLQSQGGANLHWALYNNRADNSFRLWGDNDWITVLRNGRVGIGAGATNPTRQLHVAGDMLLTGHFYDVNNNSGSNNQVLTRTSLGPRWLSPSLSGDNLGDHHATQNIALHDFFISYEGKEKDAGMHFIEGGRFLNFNMRICLFEDCIDSWPSPGGSNWLVSGSNVYRSSGNVGIGLSGPTTKLHLYDSSSGPIVSLSGQNTNYRGLTLRTTAGAEQWFYGSNNANNFVIRRSGASDDLVVNSSGNIGIGTDNPSDLLHVNGIIRLPGSEGNAYQIRGGGSVLTGVVVKAVTNPAADMPIFAVESSGAATRLGVTQSTGTWARDGFWIGSYDTGTLTRDVGVLRSVNDLQLFAGSAEQVRVTSDGKVGIGVTSPNKQLHIYKTSGDNPEINLQSSSVADSHWAIYNDRLNNSLRLWGGSNYFNILRTGQVGIGTDNPQEKLHVAGTIRTALSGTGNRCLYVTPEGNIAAKSEDCGTATGGDNLGNHLATQNLNMSGFNVALQNGYLSRTGTNAGLSLDTSNNAVFSGRVTLGAQATATTHAVRADRVITTGTGLTGGGDLTANRTLSLTNTGVTAGVYGGASSVPVITVDAQGRITSASTAVIAVGGLNGSGTTGYLSRWTGATTLGNGGIYDDGGKVGIGTTSPNSQLHIYHASSGPIIYLSGALNTYRGYSIRNTAGAEQWFYGANNSNNFVVRRSEASDDLVINSSGNMGVGVSDPHAKLEVGGNVIINNPGTLRVATLGDGLSNRVVMANSSGIFFATSTAAWQLPSGSNNQTIRHNGTNWVADSNLYNNSTNVGIGTTNPQAKLDVFGAARIRNYLEVGYQDTTTGISLGIGGHNDSGSTIYSSPASLEFSHNQNTFKFNGLNSTSSVFVGIGFSGSVSPQSNLHIKATNNTEGLRIISSNYSPLAVRNTADNADFFRVTQNGNVGIGTFSPSSKLHITGNLMATEIIRTNNVVRADQGFCVGTSDCINSFENLGGPWIVNGTNISNSNSGNVGIGTANPSSRLEVRGLASSELLRINSNSGNSGIHILSGGNSRGYLWWDGNAFGVGTGTTLNSIMFKSGNIGVGTANPVQKLDVIGNARAVAFIYTSDERLKENIKPLNNSLEKILKIRGVNFDWRDGEENQIGFIAQEIEPVIPELIVGSGDDYKGVLYGNLTALLVEAIKEQQVQINTLEQRLAEIESRE